MKLALSVKYVVSHSEEMIEVKSPNKSDNYVVKHSRDTEGSVHSFVCHRTMCIPCCPIFSARHFLL